MTDVNWWTREQLKNSLRFGLSLTRRQVDDIFGRISDCLENRRLTVVPSYLSDGMFEAQKMIVPNLSYEQARDLYIAAIKHHESQSSPPPKVEEPGEFW